MQTIPVQCPHCEKRYSAPASLAGRSVKCKHCQEVFALPRATGAAAAAAPAQNPSDGTRQSAGVAPTDRAGKTRQPPAADANGTRPGDDQPEKLGHPSAGFAARRERNPAAREIEIDTDGAIPIVMLRPSVPFDFPGAPLLDRALPPLLLVGGLGWLAIMAANSNTTGVGWVTPLRLVTYLLLALLVAFPLGYWALGRAARKNRFTLPPGALVRALGVFSFAFALPLVFWLSGESVGMLVTGAIFALVVAAGAVWFLFRVQPVEIPSTLTATSLAIISSLVLGYFLLMGASMVYERVARKSGKNELTQSPMGPTFAWDVPRDEPKGRAVARLPQDEQPITPASVEPPPPATTTAPTTGPAATTQAVAVTRPVQPPIATTQPAVPATTTQPAVTVVPATNPVTPAVVPQPPLSPIVASISPAVDLGEPTQLLFPARGPGLVAAVKADREMESIALFSGNPIKMSAATPPAFPAEATLRNHFALNATGETLARVSTFPQLAIELLNVADPKVARRIPLNANYGLPELIGFGFNDAVVLLWNKSNLYGIEVIATGKGATGSVATFNIDPIDRTPGNPSISPDGKVLAIAAPAANGAAGGFIDLWDLVTRRTRPIRSLKVPLTNWSKPTGLAFAPNSQQISAYFEQDGKGVIYAFRAGADLPPQHTHVFPPRVLYPANAAGAFTGPTLHYLDAHTLLMLGRAVIDVDTGGLLGQLQVENPRLQHVVDPQTVLLQTDGPNGKPHLLQVKLNPEALAAKRKELKPAGKP
jgi:hypothetical protein